MDQLHTQIGVCPQHDILWNELTAMDHLLFYGRIKGIPQGPLEKHARKLLNAVNLAKAQRQGKTVGQFSGGMKRRMSVAISVSARYAQR